MSALRNQSTNLSASKLARAGTDADGDTLTITAVPDKSAQGGTVSLAGNVITYTPPTDYSGPDSFTYTVSDTYGATDTGTISVTVESLRVSPTIKDLTELPDGSMEVRASGIPGQDYIIQACQTLGSWATIATVTANTNGIIMFSDQNAKNYTSRFYRLAVP